MPPQGSLYSWGLGSFGQLGHGTRTSKPEPQLIADFHGIRVRQVACGDFLSIAVVSSLRWRTFCHRNSHQPCEQRVGHTACMLPTEDAMLLYGGYDGKKPVQGLALCHFEHGTWFESIPVAEGSREPPHRTAHSAVVVGQRMIVFGGVAKSPNGAQKVLNDLWVLELGTMTWREIEPLSRRRGSTTPASEGGAAEIGPCGRYGHSASVLGHSMVLFGGCTGDCYLNDVWTLDAMSLQWVHEPEETPVGPFFDVPCGRARHATCVFGRSVMLFGGWAGKAAFGDLFCFELETRQWSRLDTTHTGGLVGPRCGHSCVAVDGGMVVVGGWNGERDLASIHTLNLATLAWESEQRHQSQSPFVPRHGHTACSVGNEIHLYGGSSHGKVLSELTTVEVLSTEVIFHLTFPCTLQTFSVRKCRNLGILLCNFVE